MTDGYDREREGRRPDVAIVVQARMSSTRLPGKCLRRMAGTPMLELLLERVDGVVPGVLVVATSAESEDDAIAKLCVKRDVECVRGPLEDVLGRFVAVLDRYEPRLAVRLTGDNPLVDARAVQAGLDAFAEYDRHRETVGVSNHLDDRTDPYGYSVEVVRSDTLRALDADHPSAEEREHVTLGLRRREMPYHSFSVLPGDQGSLRWTVDTEEDFRYVDQLFRELGSHVDAPEAVEWSRSHPHPGDLDSRGRYA